MGRRQINPGPIKTGASAANSRDYVPGISDWICVNPTPNGVMPVNVSTISGDLANAVEGVWYYYDPHAVCDISGHSTNWVAQNANGIEFYIDTANDVYMHCQQNNAQSCRVATMFMKPDGSGQFTAGELEGIDFRVEPGEGAPSTDNQQFGVAVGIAKAEICSTDSASSTDERKYGMGACYRAGVAVGEDEIGYIQFTASHYKKDANPGAADFQAVESSYEFHLKDVNEVGTKYSVMWPIQSNEYVGTIANYTSNTTMLDPSDKVYLWIQPWCYLHSTEGDNGVIRTGAFKVWYRLRYSAIGRSPDWIEGRANNQSGVSTDRY